MNKEAMHLPGDWHLVTRQSMSSLMVSFLPPACFSSPTAIGCDF
uniref:Uncharacterized protein n=1 Tax=Anguilla anguilla TaxID=7936 RepID=A0A0E9RJG8_ANGAN